MRDQAARWRTVSNVPCCTTSCLSFDAKPTTFPVAKSRPHVTVQPLDARYETAQTSFEICSTSYLLSVVVFPPSIRYLSVPSLPNSCSKLLPFVGPSLNVQRIVLPRIASCMAAPFSVPVHCRGCADQGFSEYRGLHPAL